MVVTSSNVISVEKNESQSIVHSETNALKLNLESNKSNLCPTPVEHTKVYTDTILVVDDNPLILDVLKNLFKIESIYVYTCASPFDALGVIEKNQIDLIICDVMMPAMDGYEFYEELRKNQEHSHIPFIFLTALDDKEEFEKGLRTGVDEYFVKPFDFEELIVQVKNKIKRFKDLQVQSNHKIDSFKRSVLQTLSHEFRTPLVAITTGAELLIDLKDTENEKAKVLLKGIKKGGERLEKLINDFMILQQIESGFAQKKFNSNNSLVDPKRLISIFYESRIERCLELGFKFKLIKEKSQFSDKLCKIKAYQIQIFDIFDRIVENCIKFSDDTKNIEITFSETASEVSFCFTDHGIGIDLKRIEDAICMFKQLDRSFLEQQGSGLGLYIAYKLLEINGGSIYFYNSNDKGTTVKLIFPKYIEKF